MTHSQSAVRLSTSFAALALTALVSAQGGGGGAQVLIDQVRTVGQQIQGQGQSGVAMGAVQQNGTGTIVGQIVDADSGKPIPGAIVTIGGAAASQSAPLQGRIQFTQGGAGGPVTIGGPGQNPRVLSDGDGRFAFRSLPKGSYNFTAQKPGFVDGAYGRLRPGGSSQSVDLADGENRGDVKVRLFKFASISGIVVDESGEAIVGAQIRAFRRSLVSGRRVLSAVNATAQTDDRGMYRLGSLIPGEYIVAAPNVQTSTPSNFQLQGALGPDLLSTLASPGGGFSLNTGGSPVTPDGKFLLQNNNGRTITPATPNGRLMVYATQYYPNAASTQQATAITVRSGEERAGVDMQLRMVPALNITGHLMMPDGPAVNWGVHLVPGDTSDLSADPDVATSITNGDGEFAFLAVPAGQYVIQTVRVPRGAPGSGVQTFVFNTGAGGTGTVAFSSTMNVSSSSNATPPPPPPPTDPTLWTATPIALGSDDISDLTISLRSGFKVSGRVEFQGSADRPAADRLAQIPVTVEPADGKQKTQSVPGRVDAQGNFTTTGLLPGKYFVRIGGAPSGWTFKSALLGGTDVSETPIEIEDRDVAGIVVTFNDTPTDLRGTVKSSDGVSDDSSAVVVFPSDNRAWMDYGINPRRVRLVRTSKTGTYSFGALPVGDYYLAAFSEEYAGEWQDPRFLDQLSRGATRVTLNDAEKRTQDLTRLNVRPGTAPAPEPSSIAEPTIGGPYVPEIDQLTQQTQTQAPPPRDTKPAPTPTPKAAAPARDTSDPGAGTASVAGTVVLDDATQSPLRRARVTLRGVDTRAERTVTTDDMGRFAFAGVAAGNYSLVASKAAYVQAFYGSKHAGRGPGTPLSIVNGQNTTDLKLLMPRGAVITGRAIDDFGAPVPNASVRLLQYRNLSGERTLTPIGVGNISTDDRGIYRAYGLTPGAYVVSLAPAIYGGLGSDLRMLSPNDMQAAMAAVQQGSTQAAGAATPGATLNAMNRPAGGAGAAPVMPPPGKAVGYSTVYYPGTWSSLDAQTVNVSAGQELAGIDIPVHLLPMSRLEGTVIGTDGQPAGGAQLTIVPVGQSLTLGAFSTLRTGPDGKFSTQNIAPGHYLLTARGGGSGPGPGGMGRAGGGGAGPAPPPPPPPPPPGVNGISIGGDVFVTGGAQSRLWAQQELDFAGEDVTGVTLTLQEGMTLTGKLMFAGRTLQAPADLSRMSIALVPAATRGILIGPPIAQISPSGEFTMVGVMPGKYRLTANVPGNTGWTLKSSIIDGRDILDDSLDIKAGQNVSGAVLTFTDQMAELSGRLIDAAGKPAPGFTILLFSTDRGYWPTGSRRVPPPIQPASDGKFRATGLPAGEYYLAAVTDLDPQDWGDPAFMDQIVPGAIKITIGDGEKKVQDLKVGGAS